jgi:hypothetical protein
MSLGHGPPDGRTRHTARPLAGGRPHPQQVALNRRIIDCETAQQVLETVEWAQESAVPFNSVNFATAFHRIAKTRGIGGSGINLRVSDTYCRLLDRVVAALQVTQGKGDEDF